MSRYHRPHKYHKHHHKVYPKHSLLSRAFYNLRKFAIYPPIISSVGSMVLSIILFRLAWSDKLFGYGISELRLWFLGFAILMFLIGIIALIVWMRRNVPTLYTKHDVNWRNR